MPILSPETLGSNFKIAAGRHTTVAASDVVATGLRHVVAIVVSLESDPAAGAELVTAVPGTGGNVTIETWESDLTVGTAFSKLVNWIAFGY